MRVLAVDWSGARQRERAGIRVAEAGRGGLVSVRGDLDRAGVVTHVLEIAANDPVVVGLDFSFGLPGWFPRERGCAEVSELWDLVEREGERWMADEPDPFWGRTTPRPPPDPRRPGFRDTETDLRGLGLTPKSTFQIGGAGQVGTGSLRGMPHLRDLRAQGVAVWPFDAAGPATAMEIYPTVWTDGARRLPATRLARAAQDPRVPQHLRARVAADDHAFDAACSALALAAHTDELAALPAAAAGDARALEGAVWLPSAVRGR